MYYDLHIHSALSPCSEDEMTIHNIINMSLLKGLDVIAITDHNSMAQLDCFAKVAQGKIDILLGVEIQSCEGIHVLGYFKQDTDITPIQKYLDEHLQVQLNQPDYYGRQLLLDENDEVIGVEKRLLISSLDVSVKEIIDQIHYFGGKAVLAHIYRKYGYIACLGKLDLALNFDGLEIATEMQDRFYREYPELKDCLVLCNSDAHQLGMISEPEHELSLQELAYLKGERSCPI